MAKSKRKHTMLIDIFVAVLSVAMIPAAMILYALWLKIVICASIVALNCLFVYLSYRNFKRQQNILQIELKKAEEKNKKNMSLLDAYGILGLSPQYNSDGSIKDIFDLLKIRPEYDDKGNRVLTIYELLGINPRFTSLGVEIPYVFRIKNRINALVRAKEGAVPLMYVPRRARASGVGPHMPVVLPATPKLSKAPAPIVIKPKPKNSAAKKTGGANYTKAQKFNNKIVPYSKNTSVLKLNGPKKDNVFNSAPSSQSEDKNRKPIINWQSSTFAVPKNDEKINGADQNQPQKPSTSSGGVSNNQSQKTQFVRWGRDVVPNNKNRKDTAYCDGQVEQGKTRENQEDSDTIKINKIQGYTTSKSFEKE